MSTGQGFSVFVLKARYPTGVQPLAAVRPVIESRLAAQNQERLAKALQDRLWHAENVVIREDLLKTVQAGDNPPAAAKK